jgi:hypothetical protein
MQTIQKQKKENKIQIENPKPRNTLQEKKKLEHGHVVLNREITIDIAKTTTEK